MARAEIDLSEFGPFQDLYPLSSVIGVRLASNAADALIHRVNRAGFGYALGDSGETGATPPDDTSDCTQATATVPTRGLTVTSPPNGPLFLPLGEWPLSAHAKVLRVVLGAEVALADVDVYAFVTYGSVPHPVAPRVVVDAYGVASFAGSVLASTSYKRIGTSTISGTEPCKPVILDIPVAGRTSTMARGIDGDTGARCRVFVAVLSRIGALATSADTATFAGRIVTASTFEVSGAVSRWIYDESTWRGILCVYSQDNAVIHPPAAHTRTVDDAPIHFAGRLTIHGVTITERTS
jgi:hypothetical protein